MANKKLSELTERVNLPLESLIHILDPNDLSDSPQGSDFKFEINKLVETATSLQAKRPLKTIEGQSLEGFGNVVLPAIQLLSTGLNQGGLLTINTDAAKFDLSAGFGYVVNGHSDPDNTTYTKVTWSAKIANTIPNLANQKQTYVAVDINGDLFLTNVPLTATQRRNYIRIGVLIHLNNSAVTYIDNQPTVNIEIGGQVQDILEALGFRSLSGNRVFPVSNNLKIKKELGRVFKSGANFDNLTTQPHSFTLAAQEPITFRYRTQTGAEGADITDITPAIYDLDGTITPVAATATLATIQRVYIFQDGVVRIQPGQRVFTTLNAAITALNSDAFVTDLDIAENGLYLGAIVLTRNTVDLSNISQAIFAPSIGTTANGSVASPALGYTAEDVANKQNSLAVDGTGAKYTTVDAVNLGLSGKASLDGSGKVPLTQINDALLGSVNYKGTYNATTNVPALPAAGASNKGFYYIVSTAGIQFSLNLNVGDWIISNGVEYGKVDNNNAVTSVAGRVGAVLLTKNDVSLGNLDNTTDLNKPVSTATQTALNSKNSLISHLEFNNTDLTVWNNGKANIDSNTMFGEISGLNNTTGNGNSFYARNSGRSNTTGNSNSFFGFNSGTFNTTGNSNSFYGQNSGLNNTTGSSNSFFGQGSAQSNTSGSSNSVYGQGSGQNNITGFSNSFFGRDSGRFISDNSTANANSNSSIFLGNDTKALADNQTNQIVIGVNATGAGSNTATLGNTSITSTILRGTVSAEPATASNHLVTKAQLDAKENLANKQNSLAFDGTGAKYATVDAVNAALSGKANKTFVNIKDFGAIGNGIENDLISFNNAVASIPASGGTLYIPNGVYYSATGFTIQRDNITVIGEAMPRTNTGNTSLIGGTILQGRFLIDGNNIKVENIGVDFGITYSNARRSGQGGDALVIHNVAQTSILKNVTVNNVIGLIRLGDFNDSQAAFHAILLESIQYGQANNITGIGGWFGIVIKATDFNVNGATTKENDAVGFYLKSNSYAPVARVNINNVNVSNFSARGNVGFLVQSSNAELQTVSVNNVNVNGGSTAFRVESEVTEPIVSFSASNITARNVAEGVSIRGQVFAPVFSNISIYNPSFSGFITTGNVGNAQPVDVIASNIRIMPSNTTVFAIDISNPNTRAVLLGINTATSDGNTLDNGSVIRAQPSTNIHNYIGVLRRGSDLSAFETIKGGGVTTSLANINSTATQKIDISNSVLSLATGYIGTDNPFIQSYNNLNNSSNRLDINPFGGITAFGGKVTALPATSPNELATLGQVRPYKVYTALLSQSGTNAPIATVLENTLVGTVVWSRDSAGIYRGTLTAAFPSLKTVMSSNSFNGLTTVGSYSDFVLLNASSGDSSLSFNHSSIEIRVYN